MRGSETIDTAAAKRTPSGVLRERTLREQIPLCAQ
jgi:hypothetical protein